MRLYINTGRTVVQGSHVDNKHSREYYLETSTLRMNPVDMMELGIDDGEHVRAEASGMGVVLKVISDDTIERGSGFLPLGPYANFLVDGGTHSTGMPDFKTAIVEINATDEKIMTTGELMRQLGGVPYER